ncbi:Acyltransferase 3 [Penicillium concentricum]|uniref:Acyltransferase 3 n=1 Tax=Penicillium concentricum TaxID=293559 RepID=A0A9W9UY06_9EURO|nr:Acyltransferase 3 [Penicillium concentricum]KAJ5360804.1 Acyltransferase 3 [Penicillium concentricum]
MTVDPATKQPAAHIRPSSWADGLRGIAALFVVASHTCLSFATYLIPPSFAETGKSILFQRPFFRLVIQGQAWVAIFLVLLGFVNALKPLQLARRGATADALATLSTGAFRRKWRLVFPAALMTILAWLACQFGVFQLGRRVDAYWLRATSPQRSSSLSAAVVDLLRELLGTWMYGENAYDQPQWALLPLFRGSLYVFMTLLALVNTTPVFRLFAQMVLYSYSYATLDGTVGTNIFAGMILAELSFYNLTALQPRTLFRIIPYGLVALGLYICSYPDQYADQTAWSSQLASLAEIIFPKDANVSRYYASLGAQMICLGVMLSPFMRRMLSHPVLLWLGSISFPLYLVHGPLMRSVLVYLVYLPMSFDFEPSLKADGTPDPESYIPTPNSFRLGVILIIFFAFLLYVVQQWTKHIEPKMGALTAAFEKFSRSWGKNSAWTSKEKDEILPITSVRELNM